MATNLEQAAQEYRDFLPSFRSLCLATVDETGKPDLSYAPHVLSPEGRFYVFLSDLARHTGLLRTSGCASVLLIEAEAQAQEIFARKRISFQCQAEQVERESMEWGQILAEFEQQFGEIVTLLKGLGDFHLFRLSPESGLFIKGFGQAFAIGGERMDELQHINPNSQA